MYRKLTIAAAVAAVLVTSSSLAAFDNPFTAAAYPKFNVWEKNLAIYNLDTIHSIPISVKITWYTTPEATKSCFTRALEYDQGSYDYISANCPTVDHVVISQNSGFSPALPDLTVMIDNSKPNVDLSITTDQTTPGVAPTKFVVNQGPWMK